MIDPGSMIHLADLNGDTKESGEDGYPHDCQAGKENGNHEVSGQGPQRVSGILFDECGDRKGVRPRGEPEENDDEDPDGECNSISLQLAPAFRALPNY